ncbi:MAG: VOC family protein [Planctomycetes bacterium]|nr:VOC family protein [Planctomycetota bacterium]
MTDRRPRPRFELDHVFVCAPDEAIAVRALTERGLPIDRRREHPGQGTANVCVEFANAYLELLFVREAAAFGAALVAPLALRERLDWRRTAASPFGIALRPASPDDSLAAAGVESWRYAAPFMPPGVTLSLLPPPDSPAEPMLFVVPHRGTPTSGSASIPAPAALGAASARLARIGLAGPGSAGAVERIVALAGPVARQLGVAAAGGAELRLELAPGAVGGGDLPHYDLRPTLPLVLGG